MNLYELVFNHSTDELQGDLGFGGSTYPCIEKVA